MTDTATPHQLTCPDCGAPMELTTAPAHWHSPNRHAYLCTRRPSCRGACGAHPDGTPMSVPADAYTRRARRLTHQLMDPLWQNAPSLYEIAETDPLARAAAEEKIRRAARVRTYRWLAHHLGIQFDACHIGHLDVPMLRRAYALLLKASPEIIRAWAKANPTKRKKEAPSP